MNSISDQPGGKEILVFVYGTLKEGHGNHAHFLKDRAEFLDYGRTKERLAMYDTGGFPVVFNHVGRVAQVSGELYSITPEILIGLDRLEGNGRMFERTYFDIERLDGSVVPAFMYVGVPAFWGGGEHLSPVPVVNNEFSWRP